VDATTSEEQAAGLRLQDGGEDGSRRARRSGLEAEPDGVAAALAVLLGAGRRDDAAQARRLLASQGADALAGLGAAELVALHGLRAAAARRLHAAFVLADARHRERLAARPEVRGPDAAAALLGPLLAGREEEVFVALLLDAKHRLRRAVRVSQGTLTSSLVHPREVFRPAVRFAAAALLVAHNHPSGDPRPSAEDLEVTRRLHAAGKLLGVPLLDHVVLGAGAHASIRARHGLPPRGVPAGAGEAAEQG